MIKEIPMLFSTPMVVAINNGSKTMTRRTKGLDDVNIEPERWEFLEFATDPTYDVLDDGENEVREVQLKGLYAVFSDEDEGRFIKVPCNVGDLIWVRESYLKPPHITDKLLKDGADTWLKFDYKADLDLNEIDQYKSWGWKIKPSIHMPKAVARIWLEITDIKVERLDNISEQDALAEGVLLLPDKNPEDIYAYKSYAVKNTLHGVSPYVSFRTLWQSINGIDSWNSNPWVFVFKFKATSKNN